MAPVTSSPARSVIVSNRRPSAVSAFIRGSRPVRNSDESIANRLECLNDKNDEFTHKGSLAGSCLVIAACFRCTRITCGWFDCGRAAAHCALSGRRPELGRLFHARQIGHPHAEHGTGGPRRNDVFARVRRVSLLRAESRRAAHRFVPGPQRGHVQPHGSREDPQTVACVVPRPRLRSRRDREGRALRDRARLRFRPRQPFQLSPGRLHRRGRGVARQTHVEQTALFSRRHELAARSLA
jgi:hypothetical protein